MKKLLLSVVAMAAFTTVSAQKMLVLYYSETGTTKTVAQELQQQLGADIEGIECVEPYSGNFQETIQRGQREMQCGEYPALKPLTKKIADYDVIFLGYPIWFGTYANPIVTLLKEQDFAGKTVVPFCTFGSGGLNTSKELDRFLKENGYKKGKVQKLPDYSAQKPVTADEKAIFDAACSGYQFPLGTPQTVGKRSTPDGIDYKYTVKGRGMNGEESTSIIYVTVGKAADAKPEFTEVVR